MARTALQEHFGDSVDAVITSNYRLRLPYGVTGAARFYALRPSVVGLDVTLPVATYCAAAVGGSPTFTVANLGSETLTLKNQGGTAVATIAAGSVLQVFLIDASTTDGTWITRTSTGAVESSALANQVDEFTLSLQSGVDVNLRDLCDQQGYDGVLPARVTATLEPLGSATVAVIGSSSNLTAALSTGTFPAGSIVLLTIGAGAYVCGRGGNGGIGGNPAPIIAPGNGQAGGLALDVEADLVLTNYGKIRGGGGGGGGGDYVGATTGPGGGGGAGYQGSSGGASGTGSSVGAGYGGNIDNFGPGGSVNGGASGAGGDGGAPGAAGGIPSISGGTAGAAGTSIQKLASITLTKLVAGTIDGPEVTV